MLKTGKIVSNVGKTMPKTTHLGMVYTTYGDDWGMVYDCFTHINRTSSTHIEMENTWIMMDFNQQHMAWEMIPCHESQGITHGKLEGSTGSTNKTMGNVGAIPWIEWDNHSS